MQISIYHNALIRMLAFLTMVVGILALNGCASGGGGGPTGNTVQVSGRVLRAETGLPPNPAANITIGSATGTHPADGNFSIVAPVSATTANFAATGSQPRNLAIALVAGTPLNLGDVYLSDTGYTATVTGRVVTQTGTGLQPVGNALVTLAGAQTRSLTDGTFTIANLPIGLGNVIGTYGRIEATGFEVKLITDANLQFPLTNGNNPLGDILIATPSGSTPLPPFTIQGLVRINNLPAGGATVVLLNSAGTNLGTVVTGTDGTYTFWVAPDTYTVRATSPATTAQMTVNVTLTSLDTPVTAPVINFP